MKKILLAWMLCMGICMAVLGKAATIYNVWIPKQTWTEGEAEQQNVYTKPNGLRITRQSVIPWDEEGTGWSVFIELENVSGDRIVLDENELIACNADKKEMGRWHVPAMGGAFWTTGRVLEPKERVVLFSGVDEIKTEVWDAQTGQIVEEKLFPPGLREFAKTIQRAKYLRIRLETRLNAQTKGHQEAVSGIRAWIENGRLYMEKTDAFLSDNFQTVTVLVTDKDGRLLDALQSHVSESFSAKKELAPYIDTTAQEELRFEFVGYKIP